MMRLVLTTFGNAEDAAGVIRTLVEERLAACGTILPGTRSIYAWQGKIEDTEEACVILKTTAGNFPALQERLKTLHPYETPEIIALDPTAVSGDYARWVSANTLP